MQKNKRNRRSGRRSLTQARLGKLWLASFVRYFLSAWGRHPEGLTRKSTRGRWFMFRRCRKPFANSPSIVVRYGTRAWIERNIRHFGVLDDNLPF